MTQDIEGEIFHLDKMLTSLVELLEEKGVIECEEWENKLREKLDDVKLMRKCGCSKD